MGQPEIPSVATLEALFREGEAPTPFDEPSVRLGRLLFRHRYNDNPLPAFVITGLVSKCQEIEAVEEASATQDPEYEHITLLSYRAQTYYEEELKQQLLGNALAAVTNVNTSFQPEDLDLLAYYSTTEGELKHDQEQDEEITIDSSGRYLQEDVARRFEELREIAQCDHLNAQVKDS